MRRSPREAIKMTIVLTGGGTAGHIMPNIALLPYLKKYFDKVYYIGGGGMEKAIAEKYGVPFYETSVVKLDRGNPAKNLKIPFVLPKAVAEAERILKKLRPDIVYSRGGYASLPAVLAACLLRVPVAAHEADMSLGAANKLCAPFCKKVFLSFQSGKPKGKKFVCTGAPVRDEIFKYAKNEAKKLLGIPPSMRVLLIVGGSSGARAVNECVYSCLDRLTDSAFVLHITGGTGDKSIRRKNYKSTEYTDDIGLYFAAADAVVSRAGANTAAELFALGKKTLFIPLPKTASRGDQIKNAEYYEKKGAAILRQENMNADTLTKAVNALLSKSEKENKTAYAAKINTDTSHGSEKESKTAYGSNDVPYESPNKKIAELIYQTAIKK
ncbi:MAG: undecaprenyldiphospho-muramoylpentapeptide beta-N-acetylglucosaminyltransferase [Clostridiales bacterium]|jgi:UDP-N-acetylglucosamine--N-acetylmuramyl-(pentapeptide) pyrophosphoryl-undecaprenol N-acetylglucosamine transferase|nr:undecaprenyldiphospho-muramoylpentapeptide beta-N-acetylglucosaminyltransferase [Clostridiales bacterium]